MTKRFDGVLNVHLQIDEKYEAPTGPGVQTPAIEPSGEILAAGNMTIRDRPGSVISAQAGLLCVTGLKDDCGDVGAEARVLAGAAKNGFSLMRKALIASEPVDLLTESWISRRVGSQVRDGWGSLKPLSTSIRAMTLSSNCNCPWLGSRTKAKAGGSALVFGLTKLGRMSAPWL